MRCALAGLLVLVALPVRAAEPLPGGTVARLGSTKFRVAASSVALSPDGKSAAFRVPDGVDVMSLDTGEITARLRDAKKLKDPKWSRGPHRFSFAFAPGGKEIVTASAEEEAWVWDAATGKPLRPIRGPDREEFTDQGFKTVTAKVLRVAGLQLADFVLCETWGGLHKLDVKTGKWTATGGLYDILEDVSPDGRWAAGSTGAASVENLVELADLRTATKVYEGESRGDGYPYGHTPSPDGRFVAYSANKGGVQVVNVATKKEVSLKKVDPDRPSGLMRFTPDSKVLVAVMPDSVYDEKTPPHLARWDVTTGERLADWKLPVRVDGVMAVDHANNRLVLVAGQGVFRIDLATGKITPPPDGFLGYVRPAISADGKLTAVGDSTGVVRVYEAPFDKQPKTLRAGGSATDDLIFSKDGGTLFVASADRTVGVWDVAGGKETATLKAPAGRAEILAWYRATKLALSPDGKTLVGEVVGDRLWAWDVPGGKVLWSVLGGERGAGVTGCRPVFSPDGSALYYGRDKAQVSKFDPRTGRELSRVEVPGIPKWDVVELAVSPDGKRLAACTYYNDGYLVVFGWGLKSATFPRMFKSEEAVGELAFAADGSLVVTSHADGTVRGWPADRPEKPSFVLRGPSGYVSRMQLGGGLAIADAPGATALVWKLPK